MLPYETLVNVPSDLANNLAFRELVLLLQIKAEHTVKVERYVSSYSYNGMIETTQLNLRNVLDAEHQTVRFVRLSSLQESDYPEAAERIRTGVQTSEKDAEVLELLSTALQPRRKFLKIIRVEDRYVIFYDFNSVNQGQTYAEVFPRVLLAVMMQMFKADGPFIQRASLAIGQATAYAFTPAERASINKYEAEVSSTMIKQYFNDYIAPKFKPKSFAQEIENIRNRMAEHKSRFETALEKYNELLLKQYFYDHGGLNDDVTDRLVDFLYTYHRNKIVGMVADSTILRLTLRVPLTFSESIDNYVGRSHANPYLSTSPKRVQLLKDIGAGLIKLYVTSVVQLRFPLDKPSHIEGMNIDNRSYFDGSMRSLYDPQLIINAHITSFNCFTTVKSLMVEYYSKQDYEAMFEQLFYGVGSCNPYDGAVMPEIMASLGRANTSRVIIDRRTPEGWISQTLEEYYASI